MAVAPRRRKAGLIEIRNKEIKAREEIKNKKVQREEVDSVDHQERLKLLKEIGLVKDD